MANASNKEVYIKLTNSGRWAVQKNTNKKPSRTTTTQRDAISYGRDIAKKSGASMIIYNKNGDERRRYYANK